MTTAHKTILSIVAAICITLIVFYSIKGNSEPPAGGTRGRAPALAVTDGSDKQPGAGAPTVIASADRREPAGIDEIMAKVKQLDDVKSGDASPVAPVTAESRPAPVSSNTPAVSQPEVVRLSEANGGTNETATNDGAGSSAASASSVPTDSASSTAPIVSDVAPSTPAANGAAAVPSLTLGETSPSPAASGDSGPGSTGTARSIFDADITDLAKLPPIEEPHPVPALAKVDPPSPTPTKREGDSDGKEKSAPSVATAATPAASSSSATTSPAPVVIVVDPHKPAVKEDATASPAPARSNEAADATAPAAGSNTSAAVERVPESAVKPAVAPVTPAKPADPASVSKTYTIKSGETFSSIAIAVFGAEKYWIDIADANPTIDPKKVRVGQVIKLPVIDKDDEKPVATKAADTKAETKLTDLKDPKAADLKVDPKATVKPEPKAAAKIEARVHEVKAGENLISISRRYFKTADNWRHIYLTNRELIGGDPAKLHAGMKLKITPPPLE